jgi:2-(1,2-epoxy-1,2-dihydrophenyl)acetyl-CoA isomerase
MAYKTLVLEKKDGIAVLKLNRPDRLNALSVEMGKELKDAIEEQKQDFESRVLVITGEGRAFCAGEDVKERPGDSEQARQAWTPLSKFGRIPPELMRFADSLRNLTKPTIASINGFAVGQGFSLALACDIRIMSEDAMLGAIWTRRGIPPESAGAYTLTQIVGPAKACELIFTGKMISALEAREMGLVNHVVPADKLKETTYEMARQIADGPPVAIAISKAMVYQSMETSLDVHGRLEFFGQDYCFNTLDREEGIRSFLEKRPPRFQGK